MVYANVRPAGLKSRQRENASRGSPNGGELERARSQGLKERPPPLPSVAAPASKGAKASTWPAVPGDAAQPSHKAQEQLPGKVPPPRSTAVSREAGSVVSDSGGSAFLERTHREPVRASSSQRGGNGALFPSSSSSRSGASPQRFGRSSGSHKIGASRSPEKQRKARPRSGRRVRPPANREPAVVPPPSSQFFMVSGESATMSGPASTNPASRRGAGASHDGGALPPVGSRAASHADAGSKGDASHPARPAGPKSKKVDSKADSQKAKDAAAAAHAGSGAAAAASHAHDAAPAASAADTGGDPSDPAALPAIPEQEQAKHGAAAAAAAAGGGTAEERAGDATASSSGAEPEKKLLNVRGRATAHPERSLVSTRLLRLVSKPIIVTVSWALVPRLAQTRHTRTCADKAPLPTAHTLPAAFSASQKRFRMEKVIGEGAYGVVLKCTDVRTGTTVALKQFKISGPDADDVRRTSAREVSILRQFRHPNIVAFIDEFQEASEKARMPRAMAVWWHFLPKQIA